MAIWTTTTTTTTTTITAATTTAAISQWHYCRVSIIVGPAIDRGFGRARRNCASERAMYRISGRRRVAETPEMIPSLRRMSAIVRRRHLTDQQCWADYTLRSYTRK